MITKFGSLYAGHVDLDNLGLDGTPVNERWLSDEHLATVYDKTEAIVTCMDRLGYDTFWAAEHRFQRVKFLFGRYRASIPSANGVAGAGATRPGSRSSARPRPSINVGSSIAQAQHRSSGIPGAIFATTTDLENP